MRAMMGDSVTVKGDDMVACDNRTVSIKWFHISCLEVTSVEANHITFLLFLGLSVVGLQVGHSHFQQHCGDMQSRNTGPPLLDRAY